MRLPWSPKDMMLKSSVQRISGKVMDWRLPFCEPVMQRINIIKNRLYLRRRKRKSFRNPYVAEYHKRTGRQLSS